MTVPDETMRSAPDPLILSADELVALSGYRPAAKQEVELRRQGFYRVRRSPTTGQVILERAHYEAVCAGGGQAANEPRVRPPVVKERRRAS